MQTQLPRWMLSPSHANADSLNGGARLGGSVLIGATAQPDLHARRMVLRELQLMSLGPRGKSSLLVPAVADPLARNYHK